ncbi:MAG TPA: acyl-ACP--UDP-N-acetylglucosamine O-acyltransferase [Terriglobales bacterium]|nr:acyl-ACP--UDP-N-acetylglucosamine O-acyltransferase [Terriglobales bacterium]
MAVHGSAIVDPKAKVHPSCVIGPYCVIGPEVEIDEGTELLSHVIVHGPTKIGKRNRIFPFSAIGLEPQDTTFSGQTVRLEIGDDNLIRENVTISRGTVKGGGLTRIGSHCFIMAYAHIGHDCVVGDHAMLINNATLAGHVTVGEYAVVGALSAVHQFATVGPHAYIGGGTIVTQDVLPFTKTVARREAATFGINAIGLERRGFSKERIEKIQRAYKIFRRNNNSQALEELRKDPSPSDDVKMLMDFMEKSERGIIR